MMRRAAACALLLAVALSCMPPVLADGVRTIYTSDAYKWYMVHEEPTTDDLLAEVFLEEFGYDAEVGVLDDGTVVSVNGYPYHSVQAAFNVRGVEEKYRATVDWVDYPFWQPATQYNGSLANMSLIMAICSARDRLRGEDPASFDPAQNAEAFLLDAGFSDIRKDDYSKETSIYTISTAIASRRMESEGQEPFTLIAVGVCGGGYKNEWQSNISAGDGELHEGFRSASDLVIDRICGYIATRAVKGRVKVWISGFSRAAAVANLTAGRLTRSGTFPKEDVYAYTFATPAAVKDPPQEGDENIFNIVCPTDIVPQVMPAQWGYGRYGKDLWLPVKEFSSLGESVTREREEEVKNTFGLDIHYSAALNMRMRMLVSMALEAVRDGENYAANIQDTAVRVMQNMNTSSLLSTMRTLLTAVEDGGAEARGRLDELLDYIFRVFGNAITRTELADANNDSVSPLFLLLNEHREDSYIASMNAILHGLFEDDAEFTYVMVKGPVDLELTMEDVPGWSMVLTEGGKVLTKGIEDAEAKEDPDFQEYYMERINGVSVAAIPFDNAILARWTAVSDGEVEIRQARCGVHASTNYPGYAVEKAKVSRGDAGTAWYPEQLDGVVPEGFLPEDWSAADLTAFLGISAPPVSWRIMAAFLFFAVGLALFLIVRFAAAFFPGRDKKGAAVWVLLAVFCVASVEAEGSFWMLADMPALRAVWKAVTGAAVLTVFFLCRNREVKWWESMLPGLAVAVAADLVITGAFVPGTALFLLSHALLSACFLRAGRMGSSRWIRWALLSAASVLAVVRYIVPRMGAAGWAVAAYVPVLLLMAYSSSSMGHRIRHAAVCFLVSDLLLGAYGTFWPEPLAHILCMSLFTASLMMMALASDRKKHAKGENAAA